MRGEKLRTHVLRAWASIDWWMIGFLVALSAGTAWYYGFSGVLIWKWFLLNLLMGVLGWMAVTYFGHLFVPAWLNRVIDGYWRWWDKMRHKWNPDEPARQPDYRRMSRRIVDLNNKTEDIIDHLLERIKKLEERADRLELTVEKAIGYDDKRTA